MIDILGKLLSPARVKIIRLFLLNSDELFAPKDIVRRCKIAGGVARKEIILLKNIGFIKQKTESIDQIITLKNGKIKNKKKKVSGLKLNDLFPVLYQLKNLVLNTAPINKEKLAKSLKGAGRVKLIILSGIFIQSDESKVDLLLVGDSLRKTVLDNLIKRVESEIGKELTYALFDTKEFLYRLGMYDRFVRDVLDYPHEKLFNKLDI